MTRVLIVDDSEIICSLLTQGMDGVRGITVVGSAHDPYEARSMILATQPDVITLDLELPRMDGLTFLKKLMAWYPLPVIVLSSFTPKGSDMAMEALQAGAVDVLCKPQSGDSLAELLDNLVARVIAASRLPASKLDFAKDGSVHVVREERPQVPTDVVAIGASTGGVVAVEHLLRDLPADCAPILVTQHLPAMFVPSFAKRLSSVCRMQVRQAEDGEMPRAGVVYLAPGDKHMRLLRDSDRRLKLNVAPGEKVNRHIPSVDVTFHSVAEATGATATGVLLTGMGEDGARGLLAMKTAGARTFAQDETSSVVFGMPRAAIELGAACEVVPLDGMAERILHGLPH